MPFGGVFLGGGEIDQSILLVDAHDGASAEVIDNPAARGQLTDQMAVETV